MNIEEEREKIASFIKVGIVILSVMAVMTLGMQFIPKAVEVFSTNKHKVPIYCVNTENKKVALSFDTIWGNEQTRALLACLKKYAVKATFFMTGEWMEHYPADVIAIYEDGHDLGNHSENYKHMTELSKEDCYDEIMSPHAKVLELTSYTMTLFRPPFGDYNNTVLEICEENNYHAVKWNIDSMDWKDYSAETLIEKVVNHPNLSNGSIILLNNDGKYTLQALPGIIKGLKAKGYEIVPVSQLIYTENYQLDNKGRQYIE